MKKSLFLILLLAVMIQFMSCSNETEQTACNPQLDSTQQVTPQPAYDTAANGDEVVPPIEISPAEVKKALIARGKWMHFGIVPVHKADNEIFAKYNAHFLKMMGDNKKLLGDTLTFSAPDKYIHQKEFEPRTKNLVGDDLPVWERGKDSKVERSGTFEITDQYNLILDTGKKANLNDETLKMVSMSGDRFIIVENLSFEGKEFPVYKVYLRMN